MGTHVLCHHVRTCIALYQAKRCVQVILMTTMTIANSLMFHVSDACPATIRMAGWERRAMLVHSTEVGDAVSQNREQTIKTSPALSTPQHEQVPNKNP